MSDFDQKSPLFAPFHPISKRWRGRTEWPTTEDYNEAVAQVRRERGLDLPALRFATQVKKPRRAKRAPVALEDLYDGSIALRGEVPCLTASYHDLFNAVIFAAFPLSKHALHARQFRALSERVVPGVTRLPEARTREQDALTVFDEGGSVVLVSKEFYERWQVSKPWTRLDGDHAQLWIFGHALLEHIFYGKFELRSCAVVLVTDSDTPPELLPWIDERIATTIQNQERFLSPGADGVVTLGDDGQAWLGASLASDPSRCGNE